MSKIVKRNLYDLLYVHPRSPAECGFDSKNCLIMPFFRMGCCGEEEGLLGKLYTKQITELNMDFFEDVAQLLYNNKLLDWDWESFKKNILKPNKHHIMKVCKIKDKKIWDRFYEDGYVFLNHWFDDDFSEEEDDDGETVTVKIPNRNSVFTDMDLEY